MAAPVPLETLVKAAEAPPTHSLVEHLRGSEKNRWPLVVGRTYIVGNKSGGADICVQHPSVSRRHCQLLLQGPEPMVILTDLGSTNGTTANGQRVGGVAKSKATQGGAGRPVAFPVYSEHVIRLGQCDHDFRVVKGAGSLR